MRPSLATPPDPFWQKQNIQAYLASLVEKTAILKSIGDELEVLQSFKDPQAGFQDDTTGSGDLPGSETTKIEKRDTPLIPETKPVFEGLLRGTLKANEKGWSEAASLGSQAARHLLGIIKSHLEPLQGVLDGSAGPDIVLAAKSLARKRSRVLRNRKWRSKKRQRVAGALRKERERFEDADRQCDEWRAREIAKVIAKRKMDKMKKLAEKSLKEERAKQQEEVEMILLIEKLQELRALRTMKLKKLGHFFPDEDDQFVARVRAAVEEEERQAAATIDPSAATAAIQSAEGARKAASTSRGNLGLDESEQSQKVAKSFAAADVVTEARDSDEDASERILDSDVPLGEEQFEAQTKENEVGSAEAYEDLPAEFYRYYYSSTFDMESLIEVRRAWDAFIIPGGSRIPQHWIEAPRPADAVWASYLVQKDVC